MQFNVSDLGRIIFYTGILGRLQQEFKYSNSTYTYTDKNDSSKLIQVPDILFNEFIHCVLNMLTMPLPYAYGDSA